MLIPIGDTPNDPRRVPWMNYTLIGANVLVFLWLKVVAPTDAAYQAALVRWGYIPAEGGLLQLFTCMFLHGGVLHLFGNMLYLYIFGDNVEARLGPLGYLLAYLGTGVAATLVYAGFNAEGTLPLVGASGAIAGVQGLYFVACPRHKVKLLFWIYWYIHVFYWNARLVMVLFLVTQDVVGLLVTDARVGGVAHLAHLGGFGAGLLLMFVLRPLVARIEAAAQAEDAPHSWRYGRPPPSTYVGGHSHRYPGGRRRGDF